MNFSSVFFILFIVGCSILGCKSNPETVNKEDLDTAMAAEDTAKNKADEKLLFNFDYAVANVPSPAQLVKDISYIKLPYKSSYMINLEEIKSNPNTNEQRIALLLGMNNADAVYALVNDQSGDFLKRMAFSLSQIEKLGLSTLVEKSILEKAQNQSMNRDSLAELIDQVSIRVDTYLRNNERVKIAALSFAGAWLESIYLMVKLHESSDEHQAKKIRGYLFDQKIHLGNLLKLIGEFKKDPIMDELKTGFQELHQNLERVKSADELDDLIFENFQLKMIKLREDATKW
jgi:hypothetical protein